MGVSRVALICLESPCNLTVFPKREIFVTSREYNAYFSADLVEVRKNSRFAVPSGFLAETRLEMGIVIPEGAVADPTGDAEVERVRAARTKPTEKCMIGREQGG